MEIEKDAIAYDSDFSFLFVFGDAPLIGINVNTQI